MADEKNFNELLSEAPMAASEGTTSLVGALQRSRKPGKFVLVLSNGRNVSLNSADVKDHQVLGSMIGQPLVRVTIDSDKVPTEITRELLQKNMWDDTPHKVVNESAYTWFGGHGGLAVDPDQYGYQQFAGNATYPGAGFAMATPHQAPAGAIADSRVKIKIKSDPLAEKPWSDWHHLNW
jgi:hypothetical protein